MDHTRSAFWDDLAENLNDPEFLRAYIVESMQIQTVDRLVNELDAARAAAGMTKADVARAILANDAAIRRLFTQAGGNHTVGTMSAVAAVFGLRLTFEPLPEAERAHITEPLLTGIADDPHALAEHLAEMRQSGRKVPASV
ncbi:XRE family transcriptional regulator [Planosporangium thailandense]|uniref:XRE family transcriptional regulator n=1 Tax=Planosporangium thailandense TaxID=765197 RepID=A0ABX0XT36_9ACTN|nr:XRE family transcriptional regulator [Planosporangium thailandense]NJC69164.1 XRE family transcriptional regulator [Planosporangium thailandense]